MLGAQAMSLSGGLKIKLAGVSSVLRLMKTSLDLAALMALWARSHCEPRNVLCICSKNIAALHLLPPDLA